MTTQFRNSLELQGNAIDLSSRLPIADHASDSHSSPKKKRGRPRKAIPADALVSAQSEKKESVSALQKKRSNSVAVKTTKVVDRSRKKKVQAPDFFEDEFFDLEAHGTDLPFCEDELSTLDEFEKLAEKNSKPAATPEGASLNRVDRPSVASVPPPLPRRKKVARRRQIDPATCERDYSADELEFMNALSEYKRSSGRMFPTCSEILEVLKSLGYEKR